MLILGVLALLTVVAQESGAVPQLVGGHQQVTELTDKHREIVNFAFDQFAAGDSECVKTLKETKNFKQQVVAGVKYTFDIELSDSCKSEPETCRLVVWEQVWNDFREVQWDQSTCSRPEAAVVAKRQAADRPAIAPGGISEVTEITDKHRDIANFAFSQFAAGDSNCLKTLKKAENFKEQVVAGSLYTFDIELENSCKDEVERCQMVVWEQSWRNFREVQWDKSTCTKPVRLSQAPGSNGAPVLAAPAPLPAGLPGGPPVGLPGGETQVDIDDLSDQEKEIVTFGIAKAVGAGATCKSKLQEILSFSRQVVAGTIYTFEVQIVSGEGDASCGGEVDRCTIKVLDVPWENKREVLTDQLKCTREEES